MFELIRAAEASRIAEENRPSPEALAVLEKLNESIMSLAHMGCRRLSFSVPVSVTDEIVRELKEAGYGYHPILKAEGVQVFKISW